MDTRVSMQTTYQNALTSTRQISADLATLQAQASTGLKFSQVSDDPAAALTVISSSDQDARLTAHLGNVQTVTTTLDASVSALQQVNDIFTQAKSIAIEASSSTNDQTSFGALADQVNGLLNRLLDLANTQSNGNYVFAGAAVQTQPYTVSSQDAQGNALTVQYQGGDSNSSALVTDGRQVDMNYAGNDVFQAQNRQPPIFSGHTGAAPGTGTASGTGEATLSTTHVATTFAAGSGVKAGLSSPAGDTILGPAGAHTLTILDSSGNGSSGTVSLDGGSAVSFANTDTNLRVTNGSGDTVFLDTTGITPGFSGTVAVTATGAMSIDGGKTSTPLTFSANDSVTDSGSGAVTFVDTTQVRRTGPTQISYPGTSDAFQALITLRDELLNVNQMDPVQQTQALSNHITELDNVNNQVLATVGRQSASLQSLSSLQSYLQDQQLAAKETISQVGGADIANVVVKLQSDQQLLQLALMSFAQIHSISLLNYLK